MIGVISSALSGLLAASKRAEAGASNIANLQTTGALEADKQTENAPYRALAVEQTAGQDGTVRAQIVAKEPGYVPAYDPDSPFANEDGLVAAPDVNLAEETVSLKLAETAYKANVGVLETAEEMSDEILRVFDEDV